VLAVHSGRDLEAACALLGRLSAQVAGEVLLLALGPWESPPAARRLLEAGAADYLHWPAAQSDLPVRLAVLARWAEAGANPGDPAGGARRLAEIERRAGLVNLTAGVAHDFNNLLAAILGNAELALLDLPVPSPVRHSVEQIERACRRAAELTRQLLSYTGRGSAASQPVNLNALVEDMAELLRVSISRRAAVQYSLEPALPPFLGRPPQVRQVVMNLLLNASESLAGGGGVIHLRTGRWDSAAGPAVFLEVADDGPGIDPAALGRIFDPYFTTKAGGRGLGLAAVRSIVEEHHGSIEVASEPGRGSRFRALFPALAGAAPEEAAGQPPPDWLGSGTVLLVEDDDAVRQSVERLLRRAGFTVLAAANGEEALALHEKLGGLVQAAILDIGMPGLDGLETLARMRESQPDVPCVLWSGLESDQTRAHIATLPRCAYLEKPTHLADLASTLRRLLTPSNSSS
jgi:signal transduction histidine kinase/CheY-like chemotaxis protein